MKKLILYTDGSSIKKPQPAFGSGVYIPELNIRKNFGDLGKTNQYAELYALKMALEFCANDKDYDEYEIVSDSKYGIGCLSYWRWGWQRNNYGPDRISNYEIIKECWSLEDKIYWSKRKYSFRHVRGHGKDPSMSEEDVKGNMEADLLATEASGKAAGK